MALGSFHPAVARWFREFLGEPTAAQAQGWPAIQAGQHTLIAAPTGSGKTLAAFLAALNHLTEQGLAGALADETQVVYVSPLKALSNDIERNLQAPLHGIGAALGEMGLAHPEIRVWVRTGDTPAHERTHARKVPPHIVVTTPESLYILLTSEGGRRMLSTTRTLIVDEIHALAGNKRGAHMSLSMERLQHLVNRPLVRVGLSATQRPIAQIAQYLTGGADCRVVDLGHRRRLDVALELPQSPLEPVMAGEVWLEIYDRLAALIQEHRSTLVFVNTRRLAERVTRHLSERIGAEHVTAHHGSLSREQRFDAEQRLKAGALRAIVATASLELGIDIGAVDLVCQLGSPRSIATLLQRVGRSGHAVTGTPKGRLFPLSRDELVESAALLDAIRRGELDALHIPEGALDILAQQIVAAVAAGEWEEDHLYRVVRRAWPYRALPRARFDQVVHMLADGFTQRGRRAAHIHRDAVNKRLRPRRGARLAAITSGGAIPDMADYQVVLEPSGTVVGTLNEDFAIESMAGDIFQLGNSSWRILRIESGKVRVEDAKGLPPSIPFWLGEAPGRTAEASLAVARLRREVADQLNLGSDAARAHLTHTVGVSARAAQEITDYLDMAKRALGVMPTQDTLVAERFFDQAGDMHLVVHAPFGSRLNRAWGLALRKRFCQRFNFELQAAATDDAIVLSLGPTHSFPLDDVFRYLHPNSVRDLLVQALLAAPMFQTRWRWNVTRALAVLRRRGGQKTPPALQRLYADDLLTLAFPDQVACFENLSGLRQIPDHPLVTQTIDDCLHEAMDIDALEALLADIVSDRKTLVARDVVEPSPLAQEVLSARPYAFLDDAPLEERRTQAVMNRRYTDPTTVDELSALDGDAIRRVHVEAWPFAESPDELHEILEWMGFVAEHEGGPWVGYFAQLAQAGRAAVLTTPSGVRLWIAAERLHLFEVVFPGARVEPGLARPPETRSLVVERAAALTEIVRGRLEGSGPISARALAESMDVAVGDVDLALAALESEGAVLRGRFTPGVPEVEWCERRLLGRIHRYTLARLRAEIEPVTAADFVRFLLRWQRVEVGHQVEGPHALAGLIEQLEGFAAPAAAWEAVILPRRVGHYEASWLDGLCLSGQVVWARLTPRTGESRAAGPVRTTPISLLRRAQLATWRRLAGDAPANAPLSTHAQSVLGILSQRGASFFEEVVDAAGLLRSQVEDALGELVAWGMATSDSFAGLRALIAPAARRASMRRPRQGVHSDVASAGRWSAVPQTEVTPRQATPEELVKAAAQRLLARYGVVFRRLLERERWLPPWGELLRVLRRLEAQGELRGGRFVAGFAGEQFALPDAVSMLRAVRREPAHGDLVAVAASDPLNLAGIVTPGERLPALLGYDLVYRDGEPVAVREKGAIRLLGSPGLQESDIQAALTKRRLPATGRTRWRRPPGL